MINMRSNLRQWQFVTIFAGLLAPSAKQVGAQVQCTKTPDLYASWRSATVGNASEDSLRSVVESAGQRASTLPDPFTPLFTLTPAERTARNETVVWEDTSAIALVDRFHGAPKLLIVPKAPMSFMANASPFIRAHLARVAAAAADAMIVASGRSCDATAKFDIYVNPPNVIGVRQLHVHVVPERDITVSDAASFYSRVGRIMTERLRAK
jgi:diadenosine tetraphosphate (Ap4A) HIT family hydrolase